MNYEGVYSVGKVRFTSPPVYAECPWEDATHVCNWRGKAFPIVQRYDWGITVNTDVTLSWNCIEVYGLVPCKEVQS